MRKHKLLAALILLAPLAACDRMDFGSEADKAPAAGSGDELLLGSVLALKGPAKGLGQGMQAGLTSALEGKHIGGKAVHLIFADDTYEPAVTRFKVQSMLAKNVFLMVGNVGTPTAKVSVPMLKKANVPAVGFFTGAGLLRTGDGPVLNYRASYVQETAAVINSAIASGVKPENVCAYVQNDAYGGAGITGVKRALEQSHASQQVQAGLTAFMAARTNTTLVKSAGNKTPVNQNGPIGVYTRNTRDVQQGYDALKQWERKTGYQCKLVVTVGAYDNIARFIQLSRDNGETWVVSAVSFTGADKLANELKKLGATDGVVMTQVVPLLDSGLPIVEEAKAELGPRFGFVSLEGYIVGKMLSRLLADTPAPITRESFVDHARSAAFDLGGVSIDFSKNGYQASDLVVVSQLVDGSFKKLDPTVWQDDARVFAK